MTPQQTDKDDTPQWVRDRIREVWEKRLTHLDLSPPAGEKLVNIPVIVFQLEHLKSLSLEGNRITHIPEMIARLCNLQELNLRDNLLTIFPDGIGKLVNLEWLYLDANQIAAIPDAIAQVTKLKTLSLRDNLLTSVPDIISQLKRLQTLNLNGNQITTAPAWLADLPTLQHVLLKNNPIEMPPLEILNLDWLDRVDLKKMRAYYRQLLEDGEDILYEAKLLIVGEPGAGKTTLAKKLQDSNYQLDYKALPTEGIDIIRWKFPLDTYTKPLLLSDIDNAARQFRVNTWDFGGQEIYHHTHQFFLTKRSLYVLVADAREQKTDFYYWLHIVELLSDRSPILIVINEKQDLAWTINERHLRGQFYHLKEVFSSNLATNRNLDGIRRAIQHYIISLPHVGQTLPKTWKRVRLALEKDPRNTMPLTEFLDLCQRNGFARHEDKFQLSSYLHDLGVCLHFQDDALLKNILILKPEWSTGAVYRILNDGRVRSREGYFARADLKRIWKEPQYLYWHDELLQLMRKFQLCYPLPGTKEAYIIPQLLSDNQPEYKWPENGNLVLRYRYDFMPKGILTRFVVAMHPLIAQRQGKQLVWKTGVVLSKQYTAAEIIEHYHRREIVIRVYGNISGIY